MKPAKRIHALHKALVAQSVECVLGKDEVISSILIKGSITRFATVRESPQKLRAKRTFSFLMSARDMGYDQNTMTLHGFRSMATFQFRLKAFTPDWVPPGLRTRK